MRKTAPIAVLVAASAWLACAPAKAAAASDLFYERTVMTAANARCGLFTPAVGQALAAGRVQARGAALRAGVSGAELRALEGRAKAKARDAGCASADVERAADRVRDAFAGWSKLTRMSFPGERRGWTADRTPSRDVRWRLSQSITATGEEVTLGLAGQGEQRALLAAAVFRDGERPTGARLLVRHLIRAPLPVVTGELAQRGPPADAARVFAAETGTEAPKTLLKVRGEGTVFRFPAAAADALSELDPREAVAVEFALADGRRRTAWFEVGDFAAGRVFLASAD